MIAKKPPPTPLLAGVPGEEWTAKIGSHFVKAEVKYFDASEKEGAWKWLCEG
jgi:hypothetical protein